MSEEKTEQPTDKRLREAREKGDIPKSQEIVSVSIVAVVFAYFLAYGADFFTQFIAIATAVFDRAITQPYDEALAQLLPMLLTEMAMFIAPLVGCIFITGVLAFLIQNGVVIAPKAAMPKLNNLNPVEWFKKVFSKKNLFDFIMNIVKVLVLSIAVFMAVRGSIRDILSVNRSDVMSLVALCGQMTVTLLLYTLTAFIVIALFDWIFTRSRYTKQHMMSMDEVKREYKEQEGDPHIKSKRKQLHREMQNQSKLDRTRKAKVLVVNPTHYAVALDYDKEKCPLPYMLAKGEGDMARRMIEVAKQERIPIMRNAPLARALFAEGNEEEIIPSDMLMQVAEILRIVIAMR